MPVDLNHNPLPLLQSLRTGRLDAGTMDALVHATIARMERAIVWLSQRKNLRLRALGMSPRDLACDISAELLAEGETTSCPRLHDALVPSFHGSDEELLAAFDAVIFGTIQRRMPAIIGEINPLQQQLLRALRQHTRMRDDIVARNMIDGRWYMIGNAEQAELHKPAVPFEELQHCFDDFNPRNRSDAVEVLRVIVSFLSRQTQYRKAFLEMDVLRLTIEYLGTDLDATMLRECSEPSQPHDVAALSHVVQRAIETVRSSLERFYIERGRLSPWEFEILLLAIRSSFLDLKRGEDARSGFTILRMYMPGLTLERYTKSYRRKFSYMYDLVVQEARKQLNAEAAFFK